MDVKWKDRMKTAIYNVKYKHSYCDYMTILDNACTYACNHNCPYNCESLKQCLNDEYSDWVS